MTKKSAHLKSLIADINNADCNIPPVRTATRTFELAADPNLLTGLSGWLGAFAVRAMLSEMKIDEYHIFKWRPENKYNQYLILNHYAAGCMPATMGLGTLLRQDNWVQVIRKLIGSGFFIKATLGFGSGRTNSFDRTSEIAYILDDYQEVSDKYRGESLPNEKWIIQKKLKIRKEFRVHSFGKDILYGMTFRISGPAEPGDFTAPQEFTRSVLEKLPLPILGGTLIGWDIALTQMGKYKVIEANFTGFHPEYRTGFQTSGYFEESFCGPIICAWLNAYFRNKYGMAIGTVSAELTGRAPFMEEFSYYLPLFTDEHIRTMQQNRGNLAAVYIYLGQETDFLMIKLISYLQMGNFAATYYIITPERLQPEARAMFKGEHIVHLPEEAVLATGFTEEKPCLIL